MHLFQKLSVSMVLAAGILILLNGISWTSGIAVRGLLPHAAAVVLAAWHGFAMPRLRTAYACGISGLGLSKAS